MPTLAQARQWYTDADPVHDFGHIKRVYRLAQHVGQAEGADMEILLAAVLLHDAADAAPLPSPVGRLSKPSHSGAGGEGDKHYLRSTHHLASAKFARKVLAEEGWPEGRIQAVLHCIRAHRFRSTEAPQSLEARILFDCDKLDVTGAIGVARTIAYAALAGQPLTGEVSESFRNNGRKEPGEPHTPYHEYLFKLSKVQFHTPTARALAEARRRFMAEFFEQLAGEASGLY